VFQDDEGYEDDGDDFWGALEVRDAGAAEGLGAGQFSPSTYSLGAS
jgi:hypothetical protein